MCSLCHGEVIIQPEYNVEFRPRPRPNHFPMHDQIQMSITKRRGHQVACCRSNKCSTTWSSYNRNSLDMDSTFQRGLLMNRDQNSARNHLLLTLTTLWGEDRPSYMARTRNN